MALAHSSSIQTDRTDLPRLENSRLHLAASRGDVRRVEQLLKQGVDADVLCSDTVESTLSVVTPLFCAAAAGHAKICKILLNSGANPLAVNPADGTSVLYVPAFRGNAEIATMLIKAGAVVDWTDHKRRTALFVAAGAGHDKVVELLLAAHATVDIANWGGATPLLASARNRHD